jgi:predicted enzyme related to lactoylglutathione lyase
MAKKMANDTNALNWFEIPTLDIQRATKFYETIFDIKMRQMNLSRYETTIFPTDETLGISSGALVKSDFHKPSQGGVLIYLNANPDLQLVLDRVEKAGGKVVHAKTLITKEIGYFGLINDTEGNLIALHSTD